MWCVHIFINEEVKYMRGVFFKSDREQKLSEIVLLNVKIVMNKTKMALINQPAILFYKVRKKRIRLECNKREIGQSKKNCETALKKWYSR